jgi:hypothetical protein
LKQSGHRIFFVRTIQAGGGEFSGRVPPSSQVQFPTRQSRAEACLSGRHFQRGNHRQANLFTEIYGAPLPRLAQAAALAASTSPLFRYTLPLGMRLLLRLPADSLLPGQTPAACHLSLPRIRELDGRDFGQNINAHGSDDLAQSRAENEVLVMKNYELRRANAEAAKKNEALSQANMNLEAFRNIVLILFVIAFVAYVGTKLVPQAV